MIAVIVAAAAIAAVIITSVRNAENAVHGTDRAADTCADSAADESTDRTSRTAALTRTFLGATDNALRVSQMRDRQQGQSKRCGRKIDS
jgi:hypothetical protein